jgi:hypothetical protein
VPLWENWIRDFGGVTEKAKEFVIMMYDKCLFVSSLQVFIGLLWAVYYLSWQSEIRFVGGKGIGLRRCRLDWVCFEQFF